MTRPASARVQHATARLASGGRLFPEERGTFAGRTLRQYQAAAEVARLIDSTPPSIEPEREQLITIAPPRGTETT